MTKTIYKILGKRGRITIPFEIRKELGFAYNDVVSFEMDGSMVLVKREKICDGCKVAPEPKPKTSSAALTELLDDLTPNELRTALIHLSVKWAEYVETLSGQNDGGDGDG